MTIKEFIIDTINNELSLLSDKTCDNELHNLENDYNDIINEDLIIGGVGDNTSIDDINPFQLAVGIFVELEHTNNKNKAKEIAIDHLTELPNYYTILINNKLVDEQDAIITYKRLYKINKRLLKYNKILQLNKYDKEKLDKFIKHDINELTYLIPYNFSDFMQHELFNTSEYETVFDYIKESLNVFE